MYLVEVNIICSQPFKALVTVADNFFLRCITVNADVFSVIILWSKKKTPFFFTPGYSELGKDLNS